jgi:hypothetical protein
MTNDRATFDAARARHQTGALEVVPRAIYVLGGVIPADGGVSWIPEGATGYQPANTYLVLGGDAPLIVDPGLPYVEPGLLSGLEEVLDAGIPVEVFLSRAQLECIGNIGAIAARHPVTRVYTGGVRNPFDAFHTGTMRDRRSAGLNVRRAPEGSELEIIHATLRLLNTYWGYHAPTGTLFTSDSFTHGLMQSIDAERVLHHESDDDTSPEQVSAHLLATFPWLAGAATGPIARSVTEVFSGRDVRVVAPAFGRVLVGRDVVERHASLLIDALNSAAELEVVA